MSAQLRWLSLGLALMAMVGFGTVANTGVFAQDSTATPSATSDDATTTDDTDTDDITKDRDRDRDRDFRDDNFKHDMIGRDGMEIGGMRGFDVDALATFLGVTADEIKSDLQAGSSLAEIAEANGKTRDELKTFLVEQFEAGLDVKIDASRDDVNTNTTDDATPAVDATPAASTGLSV